MMMKDLLFEDYLDRLSAEDVDDTRDVTVDDEKPWQEYCFRLDFSYSVSREDLFEKHYLEPLMQKMWMLMEHSRFAEDWGLGIYAVYLVDGQEDESIRDTKAVIVNGFHDIADARERLCEQIMTNGSEVENLFCNVFVDIKPCICKFSELSDDMMLIYKAMQKNPKNGAAVDIVKRTGPGIEDVTPYTSLITNKKEFWAHEICRELYVEMQKEAGSDNPEKLDITQKEYAERYSTVSYGYEYKRNMLWMHHNPKFGPLWVIPMGYREQFDCGNTAKCKPHPYVVRIDMLFQITSNQKEYANTDTIVKFIKQKWSRIITPFDKKYMNMAGEKRPFRLNGNIYVITDRETIDSRDSNIWRDEYTVNDVHYTIIFMVPDGDDKYLVVNEYGEVLTPMATLNSAFGLSDRNIKSMIDDFTMAKMRTYIPTYRRC